MSLQAKGVGGRGHFKRNERKKKQEEEEKEKGKINVK